METINIKDLTAVSKVNPNDNLLVETETGTRRLPGTFINTLIGPQGPKGDTGVQGSKGADGKSVELQMSGTVLQWRQIGGIWTDLIDISTLVTQ